MSDERVIYGNPASVPLPKPDLRETDPKKGSYVYGREIIGEQAAQAVEDYMAEHPMEGGTGGYYIPRVSSPTPGVLNFTFQPSEEGMLPTPQTQIAIPGCGIEPVEKTEDMTQPVGIDENGQLWVAPIGGGGGDTPVAPGSHGIVWDLVNVSSSNNAVSVADGGSLVAVLTANDGYTLGDVTITMGGEVLTGAWNPDTATIVIASVTGDVIISCVATMGVDTTAVIARENVGYGLDMAINAHNGMCITKIYEYTPNIDAIKAGKYYDAENDYTTWNGEGGSIVLYTPSVKGRAAGFSPSATGASKLVWVTDGELTTYSSNSSLTSSEYVEYRVNMERYSTKIMHANGISLTLSMLDIDDSYAYWKKIGTCLPVGVRDGDIIFAGKNTPYYGLANIDGTKPGGQTAGELSFDDDYAMDYGVAMTALVTDDADTKSGNLDTEFARVIESAKNEWMTECNGNMDKIPLIIHTDQHSNFNKHLWDFIAKIVDWHDVGKVVNLGDTANSYGSDLFKCSTLETYVESMKSIPYSKRIEIFGNHDTWGDVGDNTGRITPQNHLHKYFRNIYAKRLDNHGNFVTYDNNYNVKYIAISGFAYDSALGGYSHFIIKPETISKIVSELEKADGYDVIILSHAPLTQSGVTAIDSITGEDTGNAITHSSAVSFKQLTGLFGGRKDKTAGTFTDEYGNEYAYDFTKCNSDLLCSLHGHMHADGYYYTDGNLLSAYFDAYYISPKAIHFVIVDRENRRLNVWKVDDTPQYQNYQIPFDKPAE